MTGIKTGDRVIYLGNEYTMTVKTPFLQYKKIEKNTAYSVNAVDGHIISLIGFGENVFNVADFDNEKMLEAEEFECLDILP